MLFSDLRRWYKPDVVRCSAAMSACVRGAERLEALVRCEGVDWTKVDCIHLDEYVGTPPQPAPAGPPATPLLFFS